MDMSVKFYLVHSLSISECRMFIPQIWIFLPCAHKSSDLSPYFVNFLYQVAGEPLTTSWGTHNYSLCNSDIPACAKDLIGYRYKCDSLPQVVTIAECQNMRFNHARFLREYLTHIARQYDQLMKISPTDQFFEYDALYDDDDD